MCTLCVWLRLWCVLYCLDVGRRSAFVVVCAVLRGACGLLVVMLFFGCVVFVAVYYLMCVVSSLFCALLFVVCYMLWYIWSVLVFGAACVARL